MNIALKRYYALLSSGHLLLMAAIVALTVLVAIICCFQNGEFVFAVECGVVSLLLVALLLPLSYSSELKIENTGEICFDCGGTLSQFRLTMRHAVKKQCRLISLECFRFEQNALEKRFGVGRLILTGQTETTCLDGHTENETITERVIYGITDFEKFKQSFVDLVNAI